MSQDYFVLFRDTAVPTPTDIDYKARSKQEDVLLSDKALYVWGYVGTLSDERAEIVKQRYKAYVDERLRLESGFLAANLGDTPEIGFQSRTYKMFIVPRRPASRDFLAQVSPNLVFFSHVPLHQKVRIYPESTAEKWRILKALKSPFVQAQHGFDFCFLVNKKQEEFEPHKRHRSFVILLSLETLMDIWQRYGYLSHMDLLRRTAGIWVLVNTAQGNLFTKKQYDNFIIQLGFRCDNGANNGLMLRVDDTARQGLARQDFSRVMEIQIADDRNINDGNHNGSIFASLSGPKPPTFYDRNHPHIRGWNFMEVIADGQKITTYVNGMKVIDNTLPRDKPVSNVRSGHIGFMGYGGITAFRHIRIRPLKAGEDWRISRIAANDSREGFIPIFDGRTLNGWQGDRDKFRAENNILTNFTTPGKLETIKEYRNYVMRFEFRLTRANNNGIGFRKSGGNTAKIMICDDSTFKDDRVPFHFHGSLDITVPARRGSLNPVGQWNTMEITANGSMIRVVTNNQIIADADIRNFHPPTNRADVLDYVYPLIAGFQNKSGHIEFIGLNGPAEFRNIRVKELP